MGMGRDHGRVHMVEEGRAMQVVQYGLDPGVLWVGGSFLDYGHGRYSGGGGGVGRYHC